MRARFPLAEIAFERRIELRERTVRIRESVENLTAYDRPIGWTQHVTLGPPFLERGVTQFRASATRSKVLESEFGAHERLRNAAEFDWPCAKLRDGGDEDLRVLTGAEASCAFTTHLMDPSREHAFFAAYAPAARLVFGYVWKRADFPWMGIWEENHSRTHAPWNGRTLTRGMEFGVSPMPESRRQMIERRELFGVPAYRWLPAQVAPRSGVLRSDRKRGHDSRDARNALIRAIQWQCRSRPRILPEGLCRKRAANHLMTPILSFFGYQQHDPLDDAPVRIRYLLVMGSTAVLSLLLLYLAFDVLHIATLKYAWLFWLEWAVLTLFYAPVVCALRKSSSLVHIGC